MGYMSVQQCGRGDFGGEGDKQALSPQDDEEYEDERCDEGDGGIGQPA